MTPDTPSPILRRPPRSGSRPAIVARRARAWGTALLAATLVCSGGAPAAADPAVIPVPAAPRVAGESAEPGSLFGWGRNSECQASVQDGDSARCTPAAAAGGDTIVEVSGGWSASVARTAAGELVPLSTAANPIPDALLGLRYRSLSAGSQGILLGVTNDGQLVSHGLQDSEDHHILTAARALQHETFTQVEVGWMEAIALTESGEIRLLSANTPAYPVPAGATQHGPVRQVATDWGRALAIDGAGGLHIWPADRTSDADWFWEASWNQVPAEVAATPLVQVDAGDKHTIALAENGRVFVWGSDDRGQTAVPDAVRAARIVEIAAGRGFSLALSDAGELFAWGDNESYSGDELYGGPATVPSELSERVVTGIGAGAYTAYAITRPRVAAPVVTEDPADVTVTEGERARFTAAASGERVTARWETRPVGGDWEPAPQAGRALSSELRISVAELAVSGVEYRAVFTNEGGSVTTRAAVLTVVPWALPPAPGPNPDPEPVPEPAPEPTPGPGRVKPAEPGGGKPSSEQPGTSRSEDVALLARTGGTSLAPAALVVLVLLGGGLLATVGIPLLRARRERPAQRLQ